MYFSCNFICPKVQTRKIFVSACIFHWYFSCEFVTVLERYAEFVTVLERYAEFVTVLKRYAITLPTGDEGPLKSCVCV